MVAVVACARTASGLPSPQVKEPTEAFLIRLGALDAWVIRGGGRCGSTGGALVMLHGYGIKKPALDRVIAGFSRRHCGLLVFPLGARRTSSDGRAWWLVHSPLRSLGKATREEKPPPGVELARRQVASLLDALRSQYFLSSEQIVLSGFSQGGTLAADVALHYRHPLGGVALLSGRYVSEHLLRADTRNLRGASLAIVHGRADAISPYWAADGLKQSLRQAGARVDWMPHEGGHRPGMRAGAEFHAAIERLMRKAATSRTAAHTPESGAQQPWMRLASSR